LYVLFILPTWDCRLLVARILRRTYPSIAMSQSSREEILVKACFQATIPVPNNTEWRLGKPPRIGSHFNCNFFAEDSVSHKKARSNKVARASFGTFDTGKPY